MSGRRIIPFQRQVLLASRLKVLLAVVGVWLAGLVVCYVVLVPELTALLALESSTVEVEGTVYSHTDPSHRINRRSATSVNYRYVRGGRSYTGSFHTIDEDDLRRYPPGASVPVDVAVSDPSASKFTEEAGGGFALIVESLLLLVTALGPALYLIVEGTRLLRIRWLLRHGALIEARVTGRYRSIAVGKDKEGARRFVRYAFELDGNEYQGTVVVGSGNRTQLMVPHETLAVAYDPRKPERSCYFATELARS